MASYRTSRNVGKARYVVSFHTGAKFHQDGSPFFDIQIFTNKRDAARFTRSLDAQGYTS